MIEAVYPSAAAMAWEQAGRPLRATLPPAPLPSPQQCAACGTVTTEPVPARMTIGGPTFTEHDKLTGPRSDWTCYPCAWVMSGRPPDAIRMWSVACAPGLDLGPSHPASVKAVPGTHPGLFLGNRKDLRPLAALLCTPPDSPWCATMTGTGQKHCLPWAEVNHGAGRWHLRMDTADARAEPAEFTGLLARSAMLRQAGFTGAQITAVDPGGSLTRERLPAWREHAPHLTPWRGSSALRLANLIVVKDHLDHYAALRPA